MSIFFIIILKQKFGKFFVTKPDCRRLIHDKQRREEKMQDFEAIYRECFGDVYRYLKVCKKPLEIIPTVFCDQIFVLI